MGWLVVEFPGVLRLISSDRDGCGGGGALKNFAVVEVESLKRFASILGEVPMTRVMDPDVE
jgi:hypothetical protein